MGAHSPYQSFFLLFLLFSMSFCYAVDKIFEVVGTTECADCSQYNLQTSLAFSGLQVSVDCKLKNGDTKAFGAGEVDGRGEFKVQLPKELVQDGRSLKEECHAQLHSAAALPCPTNDGVEASKLVLESETDQKTTFAPAKNLQFSAALCSSKKLLPHFHHHHSPWFHPIPEPYVPPPAPPLPPSDNPSPPVPIYQPPMPINKPKPEPPAVKPLPPPVPFYEPIVKPLPPTVPIDEPEPKPPLVKPKPEPPVDEPKPKASNKPKPKPKPHVDEPKPKPRKPEPNPPVDKPKPKPPVVKPVPPTEPIYSPPPPTEPVYGPPPAYKPPEVAKPLLNE